MDRAAVTCIVTRSLHRCSVLFRPGGDDGTDSSAGRLVTVGPDVTVGVERGPRAGVAEMRLDGLDLRVRGDEETGEKCLRS